jgi:LytS/YehU family sensor histidine kinase
MLAHPWVKIEIAVAADELYFTVANSKPALPEGNHLTKGLGLKNVKKHLAILYPDTHALNINEDMMSFNVSLKVPLFHPDQHHGELITEKLAYELV